MSLSRAAAQDRLAATRSLHRLRAAWVVALYGTPRGRNSARSKLQTTIQSVEEDSEELKLLDRAVKIVQNYRHRNPQDQGAVADLKALHSLRLQCVIALKRIEELFFTQEDSVTEAQFDRIDIEIGQNEEALEEIEKQVRAMLEKYQPKQRRRRKKGGKAKANKASGSQSARGGSSAGGSSGAAAAF